MQISKKNWAAVSFGDVAIQQKDDIDRESETVDRYVAGGHMASEDLHIRQWGVLNGQYLGPAFRRKFEKGDILYGSRRTYLKKVAVAEFDGITANTTFVIKPNREKIFAGLLPFLMLSDSFTEHSIKHSKGSVNPYINWKDIANFTFKLPLMDEQKRISDLLWSVDELEERYLKVWCEIHVLMKSYTKKLLNNSRYTMMKIGDIATVTSGNSAPQGGKYFNGDKPFVRVQHFSETDLIVNEYDLINDMAIADYKLKLFPKDSIVFTKSGASAYLEKKAKLSKPSYVVSHLGILMADQSQIMPDYLFYIFRGLNISKNCVSDYPTIDLADIKRWKIPVPDMNMQKDIISRFSDIIKNCNKIKIIRNTLMEVKKQIINQIFG